MHLSISISELMGFITGAACVWLLVKQSIWNWPASIANFIFFIILFYRSGLYGDMALQFIYIGVSLYGWWNWLHGGAGSRELSVGQIGRDWSLALLAATILMVVLFHELLHRFTPSTVPWLDAVTTSLSLAAIFMQSRKWIENWWVWIAADVIYIGLYLYKELRLTAFLYLIFIG